jgi:hypothetical protein
VNDIKLDLKLRKFLVFCSEIDSLCIMVSSERLAGQEPQNQRRKLMPFSASSSGLTVNKLTTNCSLLVMSDSEWSFVSGLSTE